VDRRQMESAIAGVVRCLGASLKKSGAVPDHAPPGADACGKVPRGARSVLRRPVGAGTHRLGRDPRPRGSPHLPVDLVPRTLHGAARAIGLPAVIFERGVSVEDIELFVRFLHETKEQGLPIPEIKSRLARWGVTHIRVTATEEEEKDDFALAREIYGNALNVVVRALKDVRNGKYRTARNLTGRSGR